MKKAELLSPAGNFEALKGAINAGADAVYLGGELYGARAYADNFTQDEILAGLHMAHLFGKKIYLTVNTLVKEKELDGLHDFLKPFYEKGLDGVIVQDLGALRYIREHFPALPIHASTQMALTGSGGARLMKEEGVSRIVPARELSLKEIRKIKEETGLEMETFIHGAMCYCYSGQCLFSSILGGRSGNRGRCAQPCRLPYKVNGGKECYPLSMRDMCTIRHLPALLDAGIDSFKIEGRMKKPAYAAGVTAIYRKYIDLYEKDRENYRVDRRDWETLNALYIRSEISDGYYERRNGKEMISLSSPAYCAADEKLLSGISDRYLGKLPSIRAKAEISLKAGEEAELTLLGKTDGGKTVAITCRGDLVQKALKQPLTPEKVKEQIQKSGNTFIRIEQTEVTLHEPVFLPVKALNELRRKGTAALEEKLILAQTDIAARKEEPQRISARKQSSQGGKHSDLPEKDQIHVSVQTAGQLEAAMESMASRIYVEYHLLNGEIFDKLEKYKNSAAQPLYKEQTKLLQVYASAPYVVREDNIRYLEILAKAFAQGKIDGVLVRNLESFRYFAGKIPSGRLTVDAGLYVWNRETVRFWEGRAGEFYLPLEGRKEEWKSLLKALPKREIKASAVVYGRLPMMVTANCLKKTSGKCDKTPVILTLNDRYDKQFPVYTDCRSCYNVIYNSVPLSLHGMFLQKDCLTDNFRLDFTVEDKEKTGDTIRYFLDLLTKYREPFYREYTTGHYKRGVE